MYSGSTQTDQEIVLILDLFFIGFYYILKFMRLV